MIHFYKKSVFSFYLQETCVSLNFSLKFQKKFREAVFFRITSCDLSLNSFRIIFNKHFIYYGQESHLFKAR